MDNLNFFKDRALRPLLLSFILIFCFSAFIKTGECQEREEKLDFNLPVPEDQAQKQYLGLLEGDHFSIGQVKAKIVIIEIFSMYCPVCQREAVNVNHLFQLIQNNASLKEHVKMLGIGAGNSSFEVDFFKKKYDIKFPLFSDTDFSLHKKIGEVRTPHFFGVTLEEDHTFKVFYSKSGDVSDPDTFLKTLLQQSGLKEAP